MRDYHSFSKITGLFKALFQLIVLIYCRMEKRCWRMASKGCGR